MAQQEQAYSFLFKKFVCVVALDDRDLGNTVAHTLQQIPLLNVVSCSTATRTEAAILAEKRVHACICGQGLYDQHGDELYLLKRFGDYIPFIMYLSSGSAELSAECMRFDAGDMLTTDKNLPDSCRFLTAICNQIVKGVLLPLRSLRIHAPLRRSLSTLFHSRPENVQQWADECGMSRRYLLTLWTNHCGISAHAALSIFSLLCSAFTWYLNEAFDRNHLNQTASSHKKLRSCNARFTHYVEKLQPILFKKRNYALLPVRGCQEIVWERFFPVLWQFGRRKGYQYVLKKVRQQDIFYLTMKYVARERQILDSIRAVCESEKATLSGRRVVLFGSRASGNERERSDFDIGIDGVAPLDA